MNDGTIGTGTIGTGTIGTGAIIHGIRKNQFLYFAYSKNNSLRVTF
jgi:hypothetical protein